MGFLLSGKVSRYATIETPELRVPLSQGWKRETLVREYSKSGVRGDVVYSAPCGKKFKQYPDIIRVSEASSFKEGKLMLITAAAFFLSRSISRRMG